MKALNKTRVCAAMAATALLLITACSDEQEMSGNDTLVTLTAGISNQPTTRIDFTDPGTGNVTLAWSNTDAFSLYRANGTSLSPATFTLKSGSGATGTFQGSITDGTGGTYVAYYPAAAYTEAATDGKPTAPSVTGQTQDGNASTTHLAAYTFMKATADDLQSALTFEHQMAMLTFDFTMPSSYATDEVPASLSLTADANVFFTTTDNSAAATKTNTLTLTLSNVSIDNSDKKLKAYMMVTGGAMLNGNTLTFSVKTNKNQYAYTTGALKVVYSAASRYTGTVTATDWSVNPLQTNINDITDGGSMTKLQFTNEGLAGIDGSSAEKAYAIDNAFQLELLAERINGADATNWNTKFYKLTADIDLTADKICGDATAMGGEAKSWTPIGSGTSNKFKGNFDGGGHTVKGLYINTTTGGQGFFGYLDGATVKDVKITDGDIASSDNQGSCGGIAAEAANNSSVLGCSYAGKIETTSTCYAGGIVGNTTNAFIAGCNHEGNIKSGANAGGIVALHNGGTIVGCRNNGNVETTLSNASVGGIIGSTNYTNEIISCCSTGSVKGGNHGGIVGRVGSSASGSCIVDGCFFVKSSDTGSAENINGGGNITNYNSEVKNSITELNQAVTSLNNGLDGWNTRENQTKFCNYKFVAGNPTDSAMPTIVSGKP